MMCRKLMGRYGGVPRRAYDGFLLLASASQPR